MPIVAIFLQLQMHQMVENMKGSVSPSAGPHHASEAQHQTMEALKEFLQAWDVMEMLKLAEIFANKPKKNLTFGNLPYAQPVITHRNHQLEALAQEAYLQRLVSTHVSHTLGDMSILNLPNYLIDLHLCSSFRNVCAD